MEINIQVPQKTKNRAGGVAQEVEHLLCKCSTLSSNPTPIKTKPKKPLKIELLYDLAILRLGIYPKKCKSALVEIPGHPCLLQHYAQ
jgi:hypothetical protein